MADRNDKLCELQARLLDVQGYQVNPRETKFFREREYATFESSIWPKPESCQRPLYDELAERRSWQPYKKDLVPLYVKKLFNKKHNLAFLLNHKVASTSFPSYLACEYGTWEETSMEVANGLDRTIIMAVRDPVARFISGTYVLTQSCIHYCASVLTSCSLIPTQLRERYCKEPPTTTASTIIVTRATTLVKRHLRRWIIRLAGTLS